MTESDPGAPSRASTALISTALCSTALCSTALISVVRGRPSDAEIAAVVAVVAGGARVYRLAAQAVTSDTAIQTPAKLSAWSDRTRMMREPIFPGAGAWKRSAR